MATKSRSRSKRTWNGRTREQLLADPPPVLTSGQAAAILCCASRTVNKIIDRNEMPSYRLPGSNDRRVATKDFLSWLARAGISLPGLARPVRLEILAGGIREDLLQSLLTLPRVKDGLWGVQAASCPFAAGLALRKGVHAFLVGPLWGRPHACSAALSSMSTGVPVVQILPEDGGEAAKGAIRLVEPVAAGAVEGAIEKALSVAKGEGGPTP